MRTEDADRNGQPADAAFVKLDWLFLFVAGAFLFLHVFLISGEAIFYEEDHLIFLNDAWRMYRGEVMYRDFFQFTFPGTQLVYLLLFYIFGLKFWTVSLVIILHGLGSAFLGLLISRRILGNGLISYLPSAIYLFFGFRWFGLDGSHRMISPVFVLLAIFLLMGKRTYVRIAAAAVSCSAASYFTQQRGGLAVAALALLLLIEELAINRNWKEWFLKEAVLGLSYAVSLGLMLLPFILLTGFPKFLDYTVLFINNYVQDSTANASVYLTSVSKAAEQGILITGVVFFYYAIVPLVYVAGLVWIWIRKDKRPIAKTYQILLVILGGGFLALGTFAPSPARIFQVAMPALIVLVWLLSGILVRIKWLPGFAVAGLIVFGLLLGVRSQANWQVSVLRSPTGDLAFLSPVMFERYEWTRRNSDPDDHVFEVYQCAVNFALLRRNPADVPFLLNTGYTPEWQVTETIGRLERTKTRFIIWDGAWDRELETIEPGEHLGPLQDYLKRRYVKRKDLTPYNGREMQIWERRRDTDDRSGR